MLNKSKKTNFFDQLAKIEYLDCVGPTNCEQVWKICQEYSFKLHICCEGDWCRDGQELKPTTTTEQAVHEEEVAEEELKKNLFAEPTEHHDPMPDNLHGADLPFHFTEMTPKYYFGFSFGSAANMSQEIRKRSLNPKNWLGIGALSAEFMESPFSILIVFLFELRKSSPLAFGTILQIFDSVLISQVRSFTKQTMLTMAVDRSMVHRASRSSSVHSGKGPLRGCPAKLVKNYFFA
ncbi:hypothetical protein GPALN_010725 [Globodera pallida]|nr:hypothetical protein GPALN_010725 [Globodera pallida]